MEREFSSISELGSAIMDGVKRIEEGELSVKELEILTREAAELYERLVVLRFKAYDELVKTGGEETKARISTPIRITVPENQINLIDAIEEEESKEEPIAEESSAPVAPETTPEPPAKAVKASPTVQQKLDEEESLAQKLSKKPIADLKKSIGLNQKFQMITELFEGDNDSYEGLINTIESAGNLHSAMEVIEERKADLSWDEESEALHVLIELTERRYL